MGDEHVAHCIPGSKIFHSCLLVTVLPTALRELLEVKKPRVTHLWLNLLYISFVNLTFAFQAATSR
jgi:hypothetical protein